MRILDRKKKAAVIAAVRLFMEEEETAEEIAPAAAEKARPAAEGAGPWIVAGRAQAMSLRTLCQMRVIK